MGLHFFLLTTQENVGCYSGKNRLSVSYLCQGYTQKVLEETPKLCTCDFTRSCFLFKNKQTFQKLKGQKIGFFRNKGKRANCNGRVKKNNHNRNYSKMPGSQAEASGAEQKDT